MSKLSFLLKYADPNKHYDKQKELHKAIMFDPHSFADHKMWKTLDKESQDYFLHNANADDVADTIGYVHERTYHVKDSKYVSNFHPDQIEFLINHPNDIIRNEVAGYMYPSLSKDNKEKLLNDPSIHVRYTAEQAHDDPWTNKGKRL